VHAHGIDAVFAAVCRPCTVEEALAEARANLTAAARNVAQALRLGAALKD
jgi:glycerate kinase